MKWRQQENLRVKQFALFLIVLNMMGAVAFYYAVPAYQAMKHINPGWMTREIRATLSLINVIGALLIFKRYFYIGLTVLFATGTIACVYVIQRHAESTANFLFLYWDVIGLLTLDAAFRLRSKRA